ncbi:sensor histidine kinase [Bacillus sp. REN16]|uniref:sensor histidine kinase n=1 Tax=Bacillus sp. REN16 TaxID=2887296 RepID=UPI001E445862|nr:sensor histidine kinase [Bacillus sp. REN16]MCC3359004.1 sensor histidine kinase [Bacillus sp. REN16]
MRAFVLQTAGLMVLWSLFFVYERSIPTAYSIMICAAVMTLYFFLKITSKPIYLYGGITGLLLVLSVVEAGNPFTPLLLMYVALLAANQLESKPFKGLVTLSAMCILGLFFMIEIDFSVYLYFLLFYLLALQVNELWTKREEQRNLYEELLGEYRKLKRMALVTEEEARYQERTKIARDIHDSVGHKLTALLMQLEILSIKQGPEHYGELKELAKESLEETRFAVRTLKDREYEGIATILQLIKKLEAESHMMVQFTTKQGILSEQLTNQQSVVLYRVIQEGLTNAMRHSQSREVQVALGKMADGNVELIVKNRIHKKEPYQEGFGLSNMRKRVEELGGTLAVYQTDEQFVIKGMIPLGRM